MNLIDPTGHIAWSPSWSANKKKSIKTPYAASAPAKAAKSPQAIGPAKGPHATAIGPQKSIDKAQYYRDMLLKRYCGDAENIRNDNSPLLGLRAAPWSLIWDIIVASGNAVTRWGLADSLINFTINATRHSDGLFHIRQDCWQSKSFVGYNDLYDEVFKSFTGAWGGGADARKFAFNHNGEDFVIWSWKGDYMNLGAGAETGIYHGDGTGHNPTAVDMAMPMELNLKDKGTGQEIFDYKPTEDQWWINAFDPWNQGISYEELEATTVIDFSRDPDMYDSFYRQMKDSEYWSFDPQTQKAILKW